MQGLHRVMLFSKKAVQELLVSEVVASNGDCPLGRGAATS
jgi:hypothetical protein